MFAHKFSVCLWTLAAKGFTGLLLDWCRFWGWPVLLDWPPCPLVGQNKFLLIICLVFRVRSTHVICLVFRVRSTHAICLVFGVRSMHVVCLVFRVISTHAISLVFRVRSMHALFGVPSEIYACNLLVFWMRSLFLTIYLLFKCCFVAWQRWFSQKLAYCVRVKINKHLF